MPIQDKTQESAYEIYGLTRNAVGAPEAFARIAFIPILDTEPEIPGGIVVYNNTIVTQADQSGRWSIKFSAGAWGEYIVAVNESKFHVRIPAVEGKYNFDSLVIE